MDIIVDSHRSYRKFILDENEASDWTNESRSCRVDSETLPMRESIRDFDLDPPLTHKGLKDAYHTGRPRKTLAMFSSCSATRHSVEREKSRYPLLLCITIAALYSNGLEDTRRLTDVKSDQNSVCSLVLDHASNNSLSLFSALNQVCSNVLVGTRILSHKILIWRCHDFSRRKN